MSLATITVSIVGCVQCSPGGVPLAAGDSVKLFLDRTIVSGLPEFILGTVQAPVTKGKLDHPSTKEIVDGTHYTIEYDTADLLGVIPELEHCFISDVKCAPIPELQEERIKALEQCTDILKVDLTVNPPPAVFTGPDGAPAELLFTRTDGTQVFYRNQIGVDAFLPEAYFEEGEDSNSSPTYLTYNQSENAGSRWTIRENSVSDTILWRQVAEAITSPLGTYVDTDPSTNGFPGTMVAASSLMGTASPELVFVYLDKDGQEVTVSRPWDKAAANLGPISYYLPKAVSLVSVSFDTQSDIDDGYTIETASEQICYDPFVGAPYLEHVLTEAELTAVAGGPEYNGSVKVPTGASSVNIPIPTFGEFTKHDLRSCETRQTGGVDGSLSVTHVDLRGTIPVAELDSSPAANEQFEIYYCYSK